MTLDAPVLSKTPMLSTDDWPVIDADLEGMALLTDHDLLLSTDNVFGVEGRETAFYRVTFAAPLADGGLAASPG